MLFDKTISDYVERTEEKYRTQIDVSIAGTKVYGIYNVLNQQGLMVFIRVLNQKELKG